MTYEQVKARLGPKARMFLQDGPYNFIGVFEVDDQGYALVFHKRPNLEKSPVVGISVYRISEILSGNGSSDLKNGRLAAHRHQYKDAMKLFRRAAARGESAAEMEIGVLFANGAGVKESYSEALRWTLRAAHKGDPTAEVNMGTIYFYGNGVRQNYSEAVRWYRKAANQRLPEGQYELGTMYGQGLGVKQNQDEELRLMRLAYRAGLQKARLYIACSATPALDAAASLLVTQPNLLAGAWWASHQFKRAFPGVGIGASRPTALSVIDAMESLNPKQFGCAATFASNISVDVSAGPVLPTIPLDKATFRFRQDYFLTGEHGVYSVMLNNRESWGSIKIRLTGDGL